MLGVVDDHARPDRGGQLYGIGALARRTGLSVRTIRFWSDNGLVPPAGRSAAGHRLYDAAAMARLELVATLRQLGVGLDAIRGVLEQKTTIAQVASEQRWQVAPRRRPRNRPRRAHRKRGRRRVGPSCWCTAPITAGGVGPGWPGCCARLDMTSSPRPSPGSGNGRTCWDPRSDPRAWSTTSLACWKTKLPDTVLVGHSFGSLVTLGVADRVPDRIARLVMIDGVVVEPGHSGSTGYLPRPGSRATPPPSATTAACPTHHRLRPSSA